MALSDPQIDRYSRQIIVPAIGGRGQQRLLAARLLIAAEPSDLQPLLSYLVGAGVGTIYLHAPPGSPMPDRTIAEMRALNPDVTVALAEELSASADSVLVLAGSAMALEAAAKLARRPQTAALILARLDFPGKIAVIPAAPPCPACAGLLAPFAGRAETAGLIAMVAAAESFKLLAGMTPQSATILEFEGYESRARELTGTPGCPCSGAAAERS
jgi:hypothetical protein